MPHLMLLAGDRLYYEVRGSGPPLLLVSGIHGSATFWDDIVPAFDQLFTVVLHDHRGTGRSGPSRIDFSIEQMAGDVLALMDALAIPRAHLVGHSAGGAIGQTLAIDHPERIDRLVLSATWGGCDFYFRRLCEVRNQILKDSGALTYARLASVFLKPPAWLRDHPAEIEALEAKAAGPEGTPPEILLKRNEALVRFDRRQDLHRIKAPTLVIGARDDIPVPAYFSEELGRRIPGAETVLLPEGGHFFPQVWPALYSRIVLDFLSRQPGDR